MYIDRRARAQSQQAITNTKAQYSKPHKPQDRQKHTRLATVSTLIQGLQQQEEETNYQKQKPKRGLQEKTQPYSAESQKQTILFEICIQQTKKTIKMSPTTAWPSTETQVKHRLRHPFVELPGDTTTGTNSNWEKGLFCWLRKLLDEQPHYLPLGSR